MANGMPSSIGLQKAKPDRQVICLAGDGGISMLFGDLMTVVQQELPIKIAVFDNGKLGFVEIEQKAEGMLDTFTRLKNPNFAEVARAMAEGTLPPFVGIRVKPLTEELHARSLRTLDIFVTTLLAEAGEPPEGLLLTLAMGLAGGLVPALSAMRLRPLESLR